MRTGLGKLHSDQRLMLILVSVMLVLIVGVSVLAPQPGEDQPDPTTYNNGPLGVKAAYLTLQGLGHRTSRWTKSLAELNNSLNDAQAARTTLVLAEPVFAESDFDRMKAELARFMQRGGRVLATGSSGARLLGGKAQNLELLPSALCRTTPEGDSALARAGKVEMSDHGGWKMDDKQFTGDNLKSAQLCGKDAVVVQFTIHGGSHNGSAVWWSSVTPMRNAELKQDPALKLLLGSIDDTGENPTSAPRDIIFDEAMHEVTGSIWDNARGLPFLWVGLQAAGLFVLLVLSFSRRRGPVRMPVTLPRSSPVEFATSMGDLYQKGRATSAATEAARRRLLRVLVREAGVPAQCVGSGPEAVGEALRERLGAAGAGGAAPALALRVTAHLREANEAAHAEVSPHSALTLVRALSEDAQSVRAAVAPALGNVHSAEEEVAAQD